jgi:hypothetical protein
VTAKVNGAVTSPDGKLVYQFEKAVVLNLDKDQMKASNVQPFDMLDIFPLIAGTYRDKVNSGNKKLV